MNQYIYDMPMAEYCRSEPFVANRPLRKSIAKALIERSPLHALRVSDSGGAHSSRSDIGSAIHTLALGGNKVEYGEFNDWRTNAAKEFRDSVRAAGNIPLLERQRLMAGRAATLAFDALRTLAPNGKSEVTMAWEMEGTKCIGRTDWMDDTYDLDLKTCTNADPTEWVKRSLFPGGYDVQLGMRSLAHKAISHERKMVLLLVEFDEDSGETGDYSFVGLDPSLIELAERKAKWAAKKWAECIAKEDFPGYRKDIHWLSAPPFIEADFVQRTAE